MVGLCNAIDCVVLLLLASVRGTLAAAQTNLVRRSFERVGPQECGVLEIAGFPAAVYGKVEGWTSREDVRGGDRGLGGGRA